MKKFSRLFLSLIMVLILISGPVLAATINLGGVEVEESLIITPISGKYSVTYTEAVGTELTSGQQIVLLVVKGVATTPEGLTISSDNIRYIDQGVATDTDITFSNFIPSSIPNCTVLISGLTGVDGPKIVGYIAAVPVNLSGTVTFLSGSIGRIANVTITENGYPTNTKTVQTTTAGQYTFTGITEGTYTLTANAESHANYTKNLISVNEFDVTGLSGILRPGELTGDININFSDLSTLIDDYNKTRSTALRPKCDVTGDNNINFTDLSTLIDYYNKTAITE
jgi:hypothetical protein